MLTGNEAQALELELAAARVTLDAIERAYAEWRNALSYLGTWAEDAATKRAREAAEAARAELEALELERAELAASPIPDHEAVLAMVQRARALAGADTAERIEAEGRGSNWSAIVTRTVRDAVGGAAEVAGGAADELGAAAVRRIPLWVWIVGVVLLAVAVAPALGALLGAVGLARRGDRR